MKKNQTCGRLELSCLLSESLSFSKPLTVCSNSDVFSCSFFKDSTSLSLSSNIDTINCSKLASSPNWDDLWDIESSEIVGITSHIIFHIFLVSIQPQKCASLHGGPVEANSLRLRCGIRPQITKNLTNFWCFSRNHCGSGLTWHPAERRSMGWKSDRKLSRDANKRKASSLLHQKLFAFNYVMHNVWRHFSQFTAQYFVKICDV